MNNDGNLRHNNVSFWSVFVNTSGEWKLGSLEYVSSVEGNPMPPSKLPPCLEIYDPPEKTDPTKLKNATKWRVFINFFLNVYNIWGELTSKGFKAIIVIALQLIFIAMQCFFIIKK